MSNINTTSFNTDSQALFLLLVEILPKMMLHTTIKTKFDMALRRRWSDKQRRYDDITMFLAEKQHLFANVTAAQWTEMCESKHFIRTLPGYDASTILAREELKAIEKNLQDKVLIQKSFIHSDNKAYILVCLKNWLISSHRREQQDLTAKCQQVDCDTAEYETDLFDETLSLDLDMERRMDYILFIKAKLDNAEACKDPYLNYILAVALESKTNSAKLEKLRDVICRENNICLRSFYLQLQAKRTVLSTEFNLIGRE